MTFGEHDTRTTFTVTAVDDIVLDPGESVLVGFGPLPAGVSAGAPPDTVVDLIDDEELRREVLEDTLGTFGRGLLLSAARAWVRNPPCAVPAAPRSPDARWSRARRRAAPVTTRRCPRRPESPARRRAVRP